ncbi:MAG: hypothetical protein JNL67_13740 [Planctomycetaceae bacterium]|nr:hypothetical protein [Planctomycetaceae bacterium]
MNGSTNFLTDSVADFLKSCGKDYEFPAGGQHELLTRQEEALVRALQESGLSIEQQISTLAKARDWSDCYSLVILGVRLAISAVRHQQPSKYNIGLVALVAGSPKVDWRDALAAFAIFDACGKQVGIDFQAEVESVSALGDKEKLQSTIDNFFLRDPEMRAVGVFGLQECEKGERLLYRTKIVY